MSAPMHADLAIVGSGPIGAVVAREVRRLHPDAVIVMIEAGPPVESARAGGHLLTAGTPETRALSLERSRAAIQTKYVDAATPVDAPQREYVLTGLIKAADYGIDAASFPRAAVGSNVGGLGIHWTAACPRPSAEEQPLTDAQGWPELLAAAEQALSVTRTAYPTGATAARVDAVLDGLFPDAPAGRRPQRMPMAGRHDATGLLHRTGPGDVFPALADGSDPTFTLLASTMCTRIDQLAGERVALRLRPTSGEAITLEADAVVIAADVYRTPQLLYASGIRPPALGGYLNDHVFLVGSSVLPDVGADPVPPAGEPHAGAWWVPTYTGQPFHGQLHQTYEAASGTRVIGLSWYVPTELDAGSRLHFAADALDRFGMPRIRVDYHVSDADRALVQRGRRAQAEAGHALGRFGVQSATVLEFGGSLHATGTVRIGADERSSVADESGRVHGTSAVFVAGNGAVPTALSCNSTLTAAGIAVATARTVAAKLARTAVAA